MATDLDTTFSPLGPTDVTRAAQWDIVLAPGTSFEISKDKNVSAVPLPAARFLSRRTVPGSRAGLPAGAAGTRPTRHGGVADLRGARAL